MKKKYVCCNHIKWTLNQIENKLLSSLKNFASLLYPIRFYLLVFGTKLTNLLNDLQFSGLISQQENSIECCCCFYKKSLFWFSGFLVFWFLYFSKQWRKFSKMEHENFPFAIVSVILICRTFSFILYSSFFEKSISCTVHW